MGAYNNITIKNTCPACAQQAEIECQTHIASSFDGDQRGRFCDGRYAINEKMNWWLETDNRYREWKDGNYKHNNQLTDDTDRECCYSECTNCKAELAVAIEFRNCTPVELLSIDTEANWPPDYLM